MTNRIRYVSPDRFLDEDFAALPEKVQIFLLGLPTHCDREGRAEDRPNKLRAQIKPYDLAFDPEEALAILAKPRRIKKLPWILRYEVSGERYIQLVDWTQDQRPHHTERQSEIPPPPSVKTGITVKERLHNGSLTGGNGDGDGDWNGDGDGKGECERETGKVAPPAPIRGSGSAHAEPSSSKPDHLDKLSEVVSVVGLSLGGSKKATPARIDTGENAWKKTMKKLSERKEGQE